MSRRVPRLVRRLERAPGIAVPHMGWNRLQGVRAHALLEGIEPGEYAYFVHGYRGRARTGDARRL